MNSRFTKYFKQNKPLLCIYSIISVLIVLFYFLFAFVLKKPFILGNDQWFQYNIFYKEWIDLVIEFIKGKGLPMYSWNMYLGTDFYSAMGYYCTGDIFLPLLLLFRNKIEIGLIVEIIICVYIAASLMHILLKKCGICKISTLVYIPLVYAFGGQAFQFVENYMFYRFYAFLPLLFIGLLNYFKDNKPIIFIIASSILFLQSSYLMFPTLIFLFMISIMIEIKFKKSFKNILIDFFSLFGYLIVGFMIGSMITLPSMIYIFNNSRVGVNETNDLFWQRNVYAGLWSSLTIYIPWALDTIFKTSNSCHENSYSLFITLVPLLSCVDFVTRKENKNELVLLIILVLCVGYRPLSSFMHGFSEPPLRWTFLVELYILVLAAMGLEKCDRKKSTIICVVYMLGLIIQLYLMYKRNYIDYWNVRTNLNIIYACIVLNIIMIIAFDIKKSIAMILSILELVAFLSCNFYINTTVGGGFILNDVIKNEDINYFKTLDEDEYRYYHNYKNNNPPEILNQNKSLVYGFMSTSTYNSMYDYKTETFSKLSKSTIISNSLSMGWVLECDDPYANTMLGVKYYIVYKEDELPKELEFEYAYNLDYLMVYKNLNYKGFGYTSSKLKYTKDFNDTKDFYDYILVDDETIDISKYKDISEVKLNIDERYKNYFKANIDLDNDNILLIPIPNNKGWNIKVNGEKVTPISVNGGFIGLELNAGHNDIEMNFMSPYFKTGLILSCIGLVALIVVIKREK